MKFEMNQSIIKIDDEKV